MNKPKKYKSFYCCDCNGFFDEPHNHCPQIKQSEHSPSTNPRGYHSSVKEPSDKTEGISNLSDCLYDLDEKEGILIPHKKGNLLWVGDVKKSIRKLKEEINVVLLDYKTQQYRNKVFREIDKIFGKELSK